MKILRIASIALLPLVLGGCLEVDQYPVWRDGEYDGKRDNLAPHAYYHNDRMAWNAVLITRNQKQNEYNRTTP